MYSPASIHPLSKAQLHKLLKGKPVRVKHGHGMKLHLSHAQHKKLASAHKKGCGMNLQFDPYQCSMHAKGGGFLDDLEAFSVKALPALTDVGKKLLNVAPEVATMMGVPELAAPINYLVDKYTVDHSRQPKSAVPRRKQGGNIFEDFGNVAAPWLEKTLRENNLGQEKDPLAFLYGGKAKRGGRLLIDEPITTRQAVNQARDFVSDPLGTLGFGLKKKKVKKGGATPHFGMGRKQIGMGKPRKPISAAQKAALAKGRAALAAKRGGAMVHHKHHPHHKHHHEHHPHHHPHHHHEHHPHHHPHHELTGSALFPAGY